METLEKLAIYLDIAVAFIYIVLTAIDNIPLATGLAIPSEWILGVLVALVVSVIVTVVVLLEQRSYVERIDGIMVYVFFPRGVPEENKTLDYHRKYYHKKILVSYRKRPAQAYRLHAANTSYGWRLINKYPDLWRSMEDSIYPDPDTAKWSKEQHFELHPWSPTKSELKEITTDLNSDVFAKLEIRKKEGKLCDFRVVFLCPWYKFRSTEWPSSGKRILQKYSKKEAYGAPTHSVQLINAEILDCTTKVKWPWQTIKKWCKSNGYSYMDWRYSEEQLAEETG